MIEQIRTLAQSGEGFEWSQLLIVLVLIVLPILNAIKDAFVKGAEKRREEREQLKKQLQRAMGKSAPEADRPPMARAMPMRQVPTGTGRTLTEPPAAAPAKRTARATPQAVSRRQVIAISENVADAAATAAAAAASTPGGARAQAAAAARKQTAQPQRAAKPVAKAKAPAKVQSQAQRALALDRAELIAVRDIYRAEPTVKSEDVRASTRRRSADSPDVPVIKPETQAMTAEDLRRYIIMSEILGPPVALRNRS